MAAMLGVVGRALGVVSSALTALLWLYVIWFPDGSLAISGVSVLVAGLMCLGAMIAGIASYRGHSAVIVGVFVVSFLPIGAMLLSVEHVLRFVGILNVLLALAAGMIWFGHRARHPRS